MTDQPQRATQDRARAGGANPLAGTPQAAGNGPARGRGRLTSGLLRIWRTSAVPVLSVALALIVGILVILVSAPLAGKGLQLDLPLKAYGALVEGSIGKPEL